MMSLSSLINKETFASSTQKVQYVLALFRQEVVGIAQDFWKDGDWGRASSAKNGFSTFSRSEGRDAAAVENPLWHALPGEISERMWGEGSVTPADEYVTDLLIKPLNLNKNMKMLDLAAGLGARMYETTEEFGIRIDGREPDPEIAARGMALAIESGLQTRLSIKPYDPMYLVEKEKYDCVVSRETIYRVADKEKFIASIVACCNPKAQISFTDYIVNPESVAQPAILAWQAFEKDAAPPSLVEMAELWAKAGISLRVHDDETDHYKSEVKKGMLRFTQYLLSGAKPDNATKRAINKRITTWAHRVAAMEQGMKFYRFYGSR